MKRLFDRRATLRALGFAAPAIALSTVATAQPECISENPELMALVPELDAAEAEYLTARAKFEAAHEAFLAVAFDVPEQLWMTADEKRYLRSGRLVNFWGNTNITHPTKGYRPIFTVENLQEDMRVWDGRTREGKRLQRLLPVAEDHERKVEEIIERTQIRDVDGRLNMAIYDIEMVGQRIIDLPARTADAINLKVRAIMLFSGVKSGGRYGGDGYRANFWAMKFVQSFAETQGLPPLAQA